MTDSADLETRLRSLSIDRARNIGVATPAANAPAKPARQLASGRDRRRVWPYLLFVSVSGAGIALAALPELRDEASAEVTQHAAPHLAGTKTAAASPGPGQSQSAAEPVQLTAPAPDPTTLLPTIVGSGYVTVAHSVVVKSEIGGRVAKINVEIGDRLHAGDTLLILDRSDAELDHATALAELTLARAQVRSAQADYTAMQAVFERQEALFKRGYGPRADLDDTRLALVGLAQAIDIAKARVDSARLTLRSADMQLEKHVLRAPFDAVVVDLPAAPGMLISSGASGGSDRAGLLTLMDISQLYVDVDVSERNIAHISIDQMAEVRLDAFPDRTIDAHVTAISPRASRDKATVVVRLHLDEQSLEGVRPDMSAKATFTNPSDRAIGLLQANRSK